MVHEVDTILVALEACVRNTFDVGGYMVTDPASRRLKIAMFMSRRMFYLCLCTSVTPAGCIFVGPVGCILLRLAECIFVGPADCIVLRPAGCIFVGSAGCICS